MSGEAACRANPELPGRQRQLAGVLLDLGKPVIALLSSGRPLIAPWLVERADAVVATWFLGSEAGNAIADVVTGRFNPTGRLPVTWPRNIGQAPIFYSTRQSGRPADPKDHYTSKYIDMPIEPQFPFGHGLSFSPMTLKNLRVSAETFKAGEDVLASVDVVNEGPIAGEATIFLFIRDVVASVARPLLELKGLAKTTLAPGARGSVHLPVPASAFAFPDVNFQPTIEPGRFEVSVGLSADRTRLLTLSIDAIVELKFRGTDCSASAYCSRATLAFFVPAFFFVPVFFALVLGAADFVFAPTFFLARAFFCSACAPTSRCGPS